MDAMGQYGASQILEFEKPGSSDLKIENLCSLKLTASLPLKMDGKGRWSFLLKDVPIFRSGAFAVSILGSVFWDT